MSRYICIVCDLVTGLWLLMITLQRPKGGMCDEIRIKIVLLRFSKLFRTTYLQKLRASVNRSINTADLLLVFCMYHIFDSIYSHLTNIPSKRSSAFSVFPVFRPICTGDMHDFPLHTFHILLYSWYTLCQVCFFFFLLYLLPGFIY